MTFRSRLIASSGVAAALLFLSQTHVAVQQQAGPVTITAVDFNSLREWDQTINRLLRSGELRAYAQRQDTLIPGRLHERLRQYCRGIPVHGGDVTLQTDRGLTQSVFGTLYRDVACDSQPQLSADEATSALQRRFRTTRAPLREAELFIFPRSGGGYTLSYRITMPNFRTYFVSATDAEILAEFSEIREQAAVGAGRGVLGDRKKVSATRRSDGLYAAVFDVFEARDALRPARLTTLNAGFNFQQTIRMLFGRRLSDLDVALDTDNDWTDGTVVDAHVGQGWTYDYFFKRFRWEGIDGSNGPLFSVVHPINPALVDTVFYWYQLCQDGLLTDEDCFVVELLLGMFDNAFYLSPLPPLSSQFPAGVMVYGEPAIQFVRPLVALDVVAHELTHGVTHFSSDLIYYGQSGALNEAFSDIMGTSVEFFFHPPGDGLLRADYLMGEDTGIPIRSLRDPREFSHPDHVSRMYVGPEDNGGVHINSSIIGHAYYLAIEGGANRTSGRYVRGVGSANRDQIEKIFFVAFAYLLPNSATFRLAGNALVFSTLALYGPNSSALVAIRDALDAVGIGYDI